MSIWSEISFGHGVYSFNQHPVIQLQMHAEKQHSEEIRDHKQMNPISIRKLIGKPKQLIEKTSLNKVYDESWGHSLQYSPLMASVVLNQGIRNGKCSTQMQFRSLGKNGSKVKNGKYGNGETGVCLREAQELGLLGNLVFQRVPSRNNWNWPTKPVYASSVNEKTRANDDTTIEFDCKFESGNLLRAYKAYKSQILSKTYILLTHNDTNTFGYNQWFFFRARSSQSFQTIRFEIVNMRKNYSSFQKGMKIAIFSDQKFREDKIGWHRGGDNIDYSCNDMKLHQSSNASLFTIGWDYGFEKENQWVYFAYSYPYTYSELKLMVGKTKKYKSDAKWLNLCQTVLRNEIFLLKIDQNEENDQRKKSEVNDDQSPDPNLNFEDNNEIEQLQKPKQIIKLNRLFKKKRDLSFNQKIKQNKVGTIEDAAFFSKELEKKTLSKPKKKIAINFSKKEKEQKELLIIMGRAHPGQTPSSFVVQGIINGLLKQNFAQVKYLKEKLSIYVIPMLNPDGVIHGNTRTSLTGNDLNRRWMKPHSLLHPQIHSIKEYFKDFLEKGKKIFAMVDLHGHTKKQSSFLYGCCDKKNYHSHAEVKLLNVLLGKADSNFNSSFSSHFVGESKRSTARVTFYREFKCHSYTFEASFLGCLEGSSHFSVLDYYNMGKNLLKSLAYFHAATRGKTKSSSLHSINQILLSNSLLKKAVLDHFDRSKLSKLSKENEQEEEKESQGSSSGPSQCNYNQEILLQSLFPSSSQGKNESRYRAKSHNKVGKRNMSLSIEDKSRPAITQDQKPKRNKNLQSKTSFKDRKSQNYNKLPLIHFQSKQQEQQVYEFHAFNFKSKKIMTKNVNRKIGLLLESTID